MKPLHLIPVFCLILSLSLFSAAGPADARPLVVGTTSSDAAEKTRTFLPFAGYLAGRLKTDGFDRGKVIITQTPQEMAVYLKEGAVDLYIDSVYPALIACRLSGSRILLQRWKKGAGEYRAVIFVRKESRIDTLEQLTGKVIAFEDPYSTSSYFLPKTAFLERGLRLEQMNNPANAVPSGAAGYVFSGKDANTMFWVLRGKVDAGAMNHANYLQKAGEEAKNLKILHTTAAVPRHLVSVSPGLSDALPGKIHDILLRMDESEEGRAVLEAFENTSKFEPLSEDQQALLSEMKSHIDKDITLQNP